jgi:hypothetical protein
MSWTIKGEATKALDATERNVSDISTNLSIRYESLQADVLTWSVVGQLADLSDLVIPELGQEVSVWKDSVRQFVGVVTATPATVSGDEIAVEITVEGPHFWLEKTPLTSLVTDVDATEQERPEFFFDTGSLVTHIAALFTRAQAVGLPVELGTLATCYDVPRVTLSSVSFADALAALVRMVPDAVCWWDYSPAGDPEFRLDRRSAASVLTLAYGAAPLVSASLAPQLGFETEEVIVSYTERGTDGEPRFLEQTAGTGGGLGKRQVLMISGPKLSEFVPPDPIETILLSSGDRTAATLEKVWEYWRAQEVVHGNQTAGVGGFVHLVPYIDGGITDADYTSGGGTVAWANGIAPKWYAEDGGEVVSGDTLKYPVHTADGVIPDWLPSALTLDKGRISGTWVGKFETPVGTPFSDFINEAINSADAYVQQAGAGATPLRVWAFFALDFPVYYASSIFTATEHATPLGYQYVAPPASFATNLKTAQEWLPYSGQAALIEEEAGTTSARGKVLNLTGALTEWTTMKALIQGVDIDIATGGQTIRCGVPQRLSLDDIVTRHRTDPRDNLVEL